MKLSKNQIQAIETLRKYPKDIVMDCGWLTGGHGVRIDLRTVNALKERGLIDRYGYNRFRISQLGKTIDLY